jgi:WD40 repeat protein
MRVFSGHIGPVLCGAFTANDGNKHLVTASTDGTLFVWSPRTGAAVRHVKKGVSGENALHDGAITCVATHASKPLILLGRYCNR